MVCWLVPAFSRAQVVLSGLAKQVLIGRIQPGIHKCGHCLHVGRDAHVDILARQPLQGQQSLLCCGTTAVKLAVHLPTSNISMHARPVMQVGSR